ncbi:MAG: ATP-binding protein [Saprospiraceae bacterium]
MEATTATFPFLSYLANTILARIDDYFGAESRKAYPPLPTLNGTPSKLNEFIKEHKLKEEDILLLLIALAPHIQPTFFEAIISERIPNEGNFPDFGGVRGKQFRGIIPTGETAVFIIGGGKLEERFKVQELFNADHIFYQKKVLWLEEPPPGEPRMSGKIIMASEYVELFTTGKVSPPHFSAAFPAKLIKTELSWEDLIINNDIKKQIQDLQNWVLYNDILLRDWGMAKRIKPGYTVLFYGPPGTGKTMTASLLGKYTKREVYRIDLSTVVSKYIGETEKNLSSLFERAEDKNWILFFDEADALFGKRTNVRDAHDKYANQEVSYLLQRIEDFNGMVILASNFKNNIDDAFMRRFNAVIKFPVPDRFEREEIWRRSFPSQIGFEVDQKGVMIDLPNIAGKYELSGGHIINVVQHACLKALAKKDVFIHWNDILDGIRLEFEKEGKIFQD